MVEDFTPEHACPKGKLFAVMHPNHSGPAVSFWPTMADVVWLLSCYCRDGCAPYVSVWQRRKSGMPWIPISAP